MSWLFGPERRTWYKDHDACVQKVYRYLKAKCSEADLERQLVADRRTDAYGYDKKAKIWYVCEIKVDWSDLQKAVYQVTDTAFRFQKTKRASSVIPVLAIPTPLQKKLHKWDNWQSLCESCRRSGIEIWLIDSGTVKQVKGTQVTPPKMEGAKPSAVKVRVTEAKTSKAKAVRAKTTKVTTSKRKATQAKTTQVKTAKSRATSFKTAKVQTSKGKTKTTKTRKTKTARAKTAKAKTSRTKGTRAAAIKTKATKVKAASAKATRAKSIKAKTSKAKG